MNSTGYEAIKMIVLKRINEKVPHLNPVWYTLYVFPYLPCDRGRIEENSSPTRKPFPSFSVELIKWPASLG